MAEVATETVAATIDPLTCGARGRWKREAEFQIERAKAQHRIVGADAAPRLLVIAAAGGRCQPS